jgi:meso-butanediol dehydrogenase/(S,S)-butanediol dehydrogenase/diacetyl reductase
MLDVNVKGVFNCYRAAARQMISQGRGGRLIGAASVASHRGGKWQSAYSASKFAVRGMSQSVAQELAEHGITVNVYSPGVVQTPMWESIDEAMTRRRGTPPGSELAGMVAGIPLGRLETPDDVAGVVSFLASPDAGYLTGQSIVVDGGMWFS